MACKIEITKSINKSIDSVLPNRDVALPISDARDIRDTLNSLWSSAISKVVPSKVPDRAMVVINNLSDAVEKEYKAQMSAEHEFEENIEGFQESLAVQEEDTPTVKEEYIPKAEDKLFKTPEGDFYNINDAGDYATTWKSYAEPPTRVTVEEYHEAKQRLLDSVIPNLGVAGRTMETLERTLVEGFLKDFGITLTEYESMKDDLGFDSYTASDLITKSIAYQKGEPITSEVAYFAFEMLGKNNNKIRGELRYLVNNWSKYQERFKYHSGVIQEKEGFIANKEVWQKKIRDRVIIDFLKENIEAYYKNPQEFKKSLDTRFIKGVDVFDKGIWDRLMEWLETTLAKFAGTYQGKEEQLANLGMAIADEVLTQNYHYFDYKLGEGQIQKYYAETIESDPFAKELVEFGQKVLGMVLTGSLALRKAGAVFRTAYESLHDIDWVLPFGLNSNENNKKTLDKIHALQDDYTRGTQYSRYERGGPTLTLDSLAKDVTQVVTEFDWYKKFVEKYPGFVLTKGFYGGEHKNLKSITVQGIINPERYDSNGKHEEEKVTWSKHPVTKEPVEGVKKITVKHKKGDIIEGTGYAIDFFVRLSDEQEEHVNYFKLWKEIMIAKLQMGRDKDFRDWKAFVPFIKSQDAFNFNYEGFRHVNYEKSEKNLLEEAPAQAQLTSEPSLFDKPAETKEQETKQRNRSSSDPLPTATPATLALIRDFIKRIGVSVENVNQVIVKGKVYDANGAALMMQHLIQVVNGKEAQALPEEAMHFAVEIIEQTDPKLFAQLMKEINNYKRYNTVLNDYMDNDLYQTADGKPDIRKLKKEAIAQVLAETIINQNQGTNEKPELINKVQSWWRKIIETIKGVFLKSGFDTAAMKILSGKDIGTAAVIKEDSVYLQKSQQDYVYDKIRDVHNRIDKKPVKSPTGGEEEKYFIDGKEIQWRVSNLTKSWFDKLRADGALSDSDYVKAVNILKADKGTAGHKDLEYAFKLFVDEDGYLREQYKDDVDYQSELDEDDREMYELLRDNLQERLESYPEGTRFMSEVTIYNGRDVAGTVDFLAIMKDGKTDILDWKFKDINTDYYEDIPWYNIASWNRQMGQYKSILQYTYGIKAQDFRQTMMVPIRAIYDEGNAKQNIMPQLVKLEIGDVDIKKITDDYLIPVGLESQKTGVRELDTLLEKLNALYKKLAEQRVVGTEKTSKHEQMNALFKAIRHLQMKQSIEPLLDQAKTLNKQMEMILDKYETKFKGKERDTFTPKEIDDFAKQIHLAEEILDSYQELNTELAFMFEGKTLTKEDKKLRKDLRKTAEKARSYKGAITRMYTDYTVNFIGGTNMAEKIVRGITRYFGTTATLQLEGLKDLYLKASRAFFLTGKDTLAEVQRLTGLKDAYMTWARSRGLNNQNMFNIIRKADKNELIDEYKTEFYTEIRKRIQNKDYAWIAENINVEDYEEHLKEKLAEELERIENKAYPGDDKQAEYLKSRDIDKAIDRYSIDEEKSIGWLLQGEVTKFPNREKWESDEWKELHKQDSAGNYVNKPALDFYNYIRERNDYFASIGYINNPDARKFLPWIRKSFMETIMFDGKITVGEQFLRNISIDESDIGYGKIDPINGKPIDELPKYFTTEIEGESTDLFKTMALYNEMAIKFGYLSEIENQGRALIRLEKNKKAIATSVFGRTTKNEYGELELNPNNMENAKLVEDMVKAIIYGQKYIESETFDQLLGNLGSFGEKLNTKLGVRWFPENLQNRKFSVNKSLNQLNNLFQVKALGLNTLSSVSNLFGGKTQAWINSGKYFTKQDFVSTELWLLSNKMQGEDKQKRLAALDYFMPFVENYNRDAGKKLSITQLSDQAVQDWLMVLMRSGDRAVQATNFFVFLRNTIVQDGEVKNTREYLRSQPEFSNMYEGSQEERKAKEAKFEEEVARLNKEQGVLELGSVVDGNFHIPGVDPKGESVQAFRRQVHAFTNDALGSASEENRRVINMTIYGNSFMIFKNWIPRLIDVRMGNLKYNAASDAYEWGRLRMVSKIIGDDLLKSMSRLIGSLKATDQGIEYMREMFEKKRTDYEAETGKTLNMTEDQFINLVRQNIRSQIADLIVTLGMFALLWGLKGLAPDDDEDPKVKNIFKFVLKATDKLKDELFYFYDPTSFSALLGSGIFPSVGLINDYAKLLKHSFTEIFALTIGDDEWVESNQTVKYWMRTFPVSTQAASMLPMFYPELAKDLGIKMQGQYGFR